MQMSWPNFPLYELTCSCCGKLNPNPEFIELMDDVQTLRNIMKIPFNITSAYRCPNHPIEAAKVAAGKPLGRHTIAAIDINLHHSEVYDTLEQAIIMDCFTGIGLNQRGEYKDRFIHLDQRPVEERTIWTYN